MRPVRFLFALACLCGLVVAGCGGGGGRDKTQAADPTGTSPSTRPDKTRLGPARLRFRTIGHLPAPVQLPAVAPVGTDGALVMGGLDRADGSSASIVRISGASARVAGALPT